MSEKKLSSLNELCQKLSKAWGSKKQDLTLCGQILDQLKVALTEVTFLPMQGSTANDKELVLARVALEVGAHWSVAVKDIAAFERYMAQLKCYYFDYKDIMPDSDYKNELLGLNLLFLLSQNRVAEFHTELELLPPELIQSDPYIRHPLALEQYLMEGSYNKIFLAKGNVPSKSYNFFMDILLDTVRDEIGACMEKAYNKMSLNDAARRLNITTQAAMESYCTKKKWKAGKDNFYQFINENQEEVKSPFPADDLAKQTVSYASELEMII